MNTTTQKLPAAFGGAAQQMLYNKYGDPRTAGWEGNWMTLWNIKETFSWFPANRIYLHKDFKPKLERAFRELEQKKLHYEIRSFDGAFNIRNVRGSDSALSVHSWGAAIDLNAKQNPLGTAGKWTNPFLETMLVNGIFCGQNWVGRKDPMHFAMVNG